jgi:deazaflavin-dependent oxidoreductase (nitroreductase family)
MTAITPQAEERLRQRFKKYLNPFMLTMWRLGLGEWFKLYPTVSGNVMVLRHVGRKTGILRYQPLNFAIVDGNIYCVAAFGNKSDWYQNVKANPNVEIWLPDGWWAGVVEEFSDLPERIMLLRQVLIGSGFAAYAAGMNPRKMSAEELEAESKNYRLLRIQRTAARTGPGGPGDLGWIWQLATILLLGVLLFRRRR